MTDETFAAVVRVAAEWTTTQTLLGPQSRGDAITLDQVGTRFFDRLGVVEPAFSDVDRDEVTTAINPLFADVVDLVDRFDAALESSESHLDRGRRRLAVVAGLVAVGELLAERTDDALVATVESETGASLGTADRVRHSAGQFAAWLRELDDPRASPESLSAAQCEIGWNAVDRNEWRPAADAFRRVLVVDPDDADGRAGYAAVRRLRGQYGNARQRLETLLASHPDHERANVEYAELRWQLDGATAGREQFEVALERCQRGRIYSRYADALRQVGADDHAARVYRRGVEAVPDDPGLRRRYARHLAASGAEGAAREQFEYAIACDRVDPLAHLWYGRFLTDRGEFDAARDQFRVGFAHRAAGDERLPFDAVLPLLERFVDLLDDAGDDDGVVRWAKYAIDHRGELPSLDQNRLEPFEAHLAERDASDDTTADSSDDFEPASLAEEVARAVLRDTDGVDDPDALVVTGEQYLLTGVDRFASGYFDRALSLDPTHAGALLGRARVEAAGENPDQAAFREAFEWAIAADPTDPEPRRRFARALERVGAADDADAQYRAALDTAPEDAVTNCWYGQFCASRDRWAAQEHLARGLRAADDSHIGVLPRLSYAATLVELASGDGDDAAVRKWCEHALALPTPLTPVSDAQEELESALAERTDRPLAAANRGSALRDVYWYVEVNGNGCNAVLEVDGRAIHWTSNGASFFLALPVNEYTEPGEVDVTVTVLRATQDESFEGVRADRRVVPVQDVACTVTAKRYEVGDITAPESGEVLARASLDPDAAMRFPRTLEATFHRV